MSVMSGSKETLDTDSRSEGESEDAEADDERNFVLREVPHTETQTTCKLCFRPAQVLRSMQETAILYIYLYCRVQTALLNLAPSTNSATAWPTSTA